MDTTQTTAQPRLLVPNESIEASIKYVFGDGPAAEHFISTIAGRSMGTHTTAALARQLARALDATLVADTAGLEDLHALLDGVHAVIPMIAPSFAGPEEVDYVSELTRFHHSEMMRRRMH